MFRACLLASVAAFALAVPPVSALTPVGISEIDTNGDGNLSREEMRAAGMNPFLAAAADADGNGVLTRAERETYNAIQKFISRLEDPAKRAEIAAHFEASQKSPLTDDGFSVAETLLRIDSIKRDWPRGRWGNGWLELSYKDATEGWGPGIRDRVARAATLVETFDKETASEQRRLARAEQRRQHDDDDDDKTPVVVASAPAPTSGDDTPELPPAPGGGDTFDPIPEPEDGFDPGGDPFGSEGGPEDDFGPGGTFDVEGGDDFDPEV